MIKTDKVIYHTRTLEQFDWLMKQLEEDGCMWVNGELATKGKFYYRYLSATCIWLYGRTITYGDYDYYKKNTQEYNGWEFIEISDITYNC